MAETQDWAGIRDMIALEFDEHGHSAELTVMRIQLAQVEQTSRLADAVEGVLAEMKAARKWKEAERESKIRMP